MSSRAWGDLNPYDLHKALINEYFLTTKGALASLKRDASKDKTDFDVIKENHKFLWDENDEKNLDTWEKRLAKRYYDKLYKEYCIADLSRYKENKFGLRWRTKEELISGRGQFTCGNKRCTIKEELRTWEVNFAYVEENERKNALIKLRLCPPCSIKLNYCHKKREVKRSRRRKSKEIHSSAQKSTSKCTEKVSIGDENERKMNEADPVEKDESDVWKQDKVEEEKSRDEEFEEYLEELFL